MALVVEGDLRVAHQTARWFAFLVPLALASVAVVVATTGATGARQWIALAALAVTWAGYALLGRRLIRTNGRPAGFHVALIVGLAIGIAAEANVALAQMVTVPLIWLTARSTRDSLLTSLASMLIGVAALCVGLGVSALPSALAAQAMGYGFGIGFGLWLNSLTGELERSQALAAQESAERAALAERNRIALDLHDTIAQDLVGIALLAQRGTKAPSPQVTHRIEQLANESLSELRSLASAQAPLSLASGLRSALTRLAERFERDTRIPVRVEASDAPLTSRVQVSLLRVAQESLANIRWHAQACTVRLRLEISQRQAILTITDDGVGFDPAKAQRGLGLDGFRERAAAHGGEVRISSDDHGTEVQFSLPLAPERDS